MTAQPLTDFRWLSPLGISVVLFLLLGAFHILIGILTPVFVRADRITSNILLTSTRPDTALLGASPEDLIAKDRPLGLVRVVTVNWLAGYMIGFGILQVMVSWVGLRAGQSWALWSLTAAGFAMVPAIWMSLRPFAQAGTMPGLGEMPPFITFLVVVPIAAVLGWIGLR
ncbi:MAG TPA: hypothetical protein VJ160_08925 [Anaerolineales bacterium]|nr:hypothetical protein [Anaerolineales bacterium]